MKFFVDTADLGEIRDLAESGLVDGVTTNPSLIAKSGRNMLDVIAEICDIVPGPVSAEVTATDHKNMMAEADVLTAIASNVAIKVPLTPEGLRTCKTLRDRDIMVNVTLCFSAGQAILAAKAGASFISPFVGRLDDTGLRGIDLIEDIVEIYSHYGNFETEVLVASVRGPAHVVESAMAGAHVATLPPGVLRQLYQHPLTERGLTDFLKDWEATGQSILGEANDRKNAAE
ncbi:MAG TPA: fructose-6-phosphate aldolase [Rhodospirillaceae bacterium]|nr:fructose-6-phosphate aldolase [Rhodospirillaceae bacterium]|tara:strand:- start:487 stop:1176 length:690 start_codon:yes stop_codon:yes gene_type:complete